MVVDHLHHVSSFRDHALDEGHLGAARILEYDDVPPMDGSHGKDLSLPLKIHGAITNRLTRSLSPTNRVFFMDPEGMLLFWKTQVRAKRTKMSTTQIVSQ
ncbi:MAG: hypothetical protein P8Z49_02330 [Acidobacteriota bacterium]